MTTKCSPERPAGRVKEWSRVPWTSWGRQGQWWMPAVCVCLQTGFRYCLPRDKVLCWVFLSAAPCNGACGARLCLALATSIHLSLCTNVSNFWSKWLDLTDRPQQQVTCHGFYIRTWNFSCDVRGCFQHNPASLSSSVLSVCFLNIQPHLEQGGLTQFLVT